MSFFPAHKLIGAAFTAAVVCGAVQAETIGVSESEIHIGQLGPLTGENYLYGDLVMVGNEMIFQEVNEAGGIHGRKIVTTRVDSQCRSQPAVSAARRLVDSDVLAITGMGCSNASLANRDIIIDAGIPTIVQGATHDDLTDGGEDGVIFRAVLQGSEEGRIQARYVDTIPGVERVAIVAQHDAWGQAKYDGFMQEAANFDWEIVADEEMVADSVDATAQVARIAEAEPDVIVTLVYPRPSVVFLREAHQQGISDRPIIGHTSVSDVDKLAKDVGNPEAVRHFHTIALTAFTPDMAEAADIRARFEAVHGGRNLTQYALWGIGAAEVLVAALEEAGPDVTRESLADTLRTMGPIETSVFPQPIEYSADSHDGNTAGMFMRYDLEEEAAVPIGTEFDPSTM